MSLLKLTPVGQDVQLFNTNRMQFAIENTSGSQFSYNYLNTIQSIDISEVYSSFIEAFHKNCQSDSITLSIVSSNNFIVQKEQPIITNNIVHAYNDPNGTRIIYSDSPIGISPAKREILLVSETIDEILTKLQFIPTPLGSSAYLYVAYASDINGASFTLINNPALEFMAVLATDMEIQNPVVSDFTGLWYKRKGEAGTSGIDGTDGTNGTNGENGLTPYIGENGNWWIGTTDTGVPAEVDQTLYCYIAWRDAPNVGFTLEPTGGAAFEAILYTHTQLTNPVEANFEGLWRSIIPPLEIHNVPKGGTTSQKLIKGSNADYDTIWVDDYVIKANPANGTASGFKTQYVANESQVFGDVCYINATGKAQKADRSATATSFATLICLGTVAANGTGVYLKNGYIRNDAWNWNVRLPIYLDTTGGMTQTAPSTITHVAQVLAIPVSATVLDFSPSLSQVEYK